MCGDESGEFRTLTLRDTPNYLPKEDALCRRHAERHRLNALGEMRAEIAAIRQRPRNRSDRATQKLSKIARPPPPDLFSEGAINSWSQCMQPIKALDDSIEAVIAEGRRRADAVKQRDEEERQALALIAQMERRMAAMPSTTPSLSSEKIAAVVERFVELSHRCVASFRSEQSSAAQMTTELRRAVADAETQLSAIVAEAAKDKVPPPPPQKVPLAAEPVKAEATPVVIGVGSTSVESRVYIAALDLIRRQDAKCSVLSQSAQLKPLKNSYTLFVATCVNTISSRGFSEVRDNVGKVLAFFRGVEVPSSGAKKISLAHHAEAYDFCLLIMTQRIVKQAIDKGELPDSLGSLMTLGIFVREIWSSIPAFGDLLLAQLYVRCPALIPFVPNKSNVTPTATVLGCSKLLAAITLRPAPQIVPGSRHPYAIGNAWRILASTMNGEDVRADAPKVVYCLLTVAGEEMQETYRMQFAKMIRSVEQCFVGRLGVLGKACSMDVQRLEIYSRHYRQHRSVPLTKGRLPVTFWSA